MVFAYDMVFIGQYATKLHFEEFNIQDGKYNNVDLCPAY